MIRGLPAEASSSGLPRWRGDYTITLHFSSAPQSRSRSCLQRPFPVAPMYVMFPLIRKTRIRRFS